jgi:hypothetical protein
MRIWVETVALSGLVSSVTTLYQNLIINIEPRDLHRDSLAPPLVLSGHVLMIMIMLLLDWI